MNPFGLDHWIENAAAVDYLQQQTHMTSGTCDFSTDPVILHIMLFLILINDSYMQSNAFISTNRLFTDKMDLYISCIPDDLLPEETCTAALLFIDPAQFRDTGNRLHKTGK